MYLLIDADFYLPVDELKDYWMVSYLYLILGSEWGFNIYKFVSKASIFDTPLLCAILFMFVQLLGIS